MQHLRGKVTSAKACVTTQQLYLSRSWHSLGSTGLLSAQSLAVELRLLHVLLADLRRAWQARLVASCWTPSPAVRGWAQMPTPAFTATKKVRTIPSSSCEMCAPLQSIPARNEFRHTWYVNPNLVLHQRPDGLANDENAARAVCKSVGIVWSCKSLNSERAF